MLLLTLKINGAVNQRCSLKFVPVVIFFLGKILDEMNMLPIAYIDGT